MPFAHLRLNLVPVGQQRRWRCLTPLVGKRTFGGRGPESKPAAEEEEDLRQADLHCLRVSGEEARQRATLVGRNDCRVIARMEGTALLLCYQSECRSVVIPYPSSSRL